MAETGNNEKIAQALLPALAAVLGIWFLNIAEVQSAPFLLLLLVAIYVLGVLLLRFAEAEMRLPKGDALYAAYGIAALASVPVAFVSLGESPALALQSTGLLLYILLLLPIVNEMARGRMTSVQPQ